MRRILMLCLAVLMLAPLPAAAGPLLIGDTVTVVNSGTNPGMTVGVDLPWVSYKGDALVGVENLTIDGVGYQGFCIDLYHFAALDASLNYEVANLADSPEAVPPDKMGSERADFIREMWAYGYENALLGNQAAAGFQLAIWGVLQGSISGGIVTPDWSFLQNPSVLYGADALILWANTNNGPLADLLGLNHLSVTGAPTNQSYVVAVPDGGMTLVLLGGALIGLGALRRRFRS